MHRFYDYPPHHPDHPANQAARAKAGAQEGQAVTLDWAEILDEWPALVYDFQVVAGVDLVKAWRKDRREWAWFRYIVQGLLATPTSRLRARLMPTAAEQQNAAEDRGFDDAPPAAVA